MLVVLAVIIILGGAVTIPLCGYHSNTRQKAAADGIRRPHGRRPRQRDGTGDVVPPRDQSDGTRIRLAPDGPDFASLPADNPPAFDSESSKTASRRASPPR